ncbi:MAG: Holliday junction resolvase RuvX [Candidatus Cloacimonetes bacterium]|nr:Holliday junction resolvase RuvX [Candidatus Cloacimonadota bacterium]
MALYRIMGIDHGAVRIGIAISDPMQIIARPYKVIINNDGLLDEITSIIKKENIGKIIIGLPLNLAGQDTQKTKEVRDFAEKLKKDISIPVILWDERYTTVEANEALQEMGYNIHESKDVIDKVAASLILRNYLENSE